MTHIKRFFQPPSRSFFLFGPRGTGKSTFLQQYYADRAIHIDLLQADIERAYSAKPERIHALLDAQPQKKIIIIDEIQRVPTLLPVVHALIFVDKSLQFILTGSSARKIKRVDTDLLGGRASQRKLHPFMAAELKEEFSLQHALAYGMLPLLYHETAFTDVLHAYINLYLQQEVYVRGVITARHPINCFFGELEQA